MARTVIALVAATCLLVGCARSAGLPSVQPAASPELPTDTAVPAKRLADSTLGFSLLYPASWQLRDRVLATEFANGADCASVEIVDSPLPPGSSSGASIRHSVVQICAKPLADRLSLDEFLRSSYGNAVASQFQTTQLAGIPAYRMTNANQDVTIFAQTHAYRMQIVTAVVAEPDKRAERQLQVERILESFSFR